jgi:hypothetical protein
MIQVHLMTLGRIHLPRENVTMIQAGRVKVISFVHLVRDIIIKVIYISNLIKSNKFQKRKLNTVFYPHSYSQILLKRHK